MWHLDLIFMHSLTCVVLGAVQIVAQQFEFGKKIMAKGLIPILEPEVNINSPEKSKCEEMLLAEIIENVSVSPIVLCHEKVHFQHDPI